MNKYPKLHEMSLQLLINLIEEQEYQGRNGVRWQKLVDEACSRIGLNARKPADINEYKFRVNNLKQIKELHPEYFL